MPPVISEAPEASSPPSESHVDDSIPVVPLRHPIRKAVAILLLVLAGAAAWNVATNRRFGWDVVATYLLSPEILRGALLTVVLTVISMIAGIALGTVLAVMRISDNPIVSRISRGFIWFFRGTPLLVQLIFWYNIAALYPTVSIGIPFGGPDFVLGSANSLITPLAAALLGLSLERSGIHGRDHPRWNRIGRHGSVRRRTSTGNEQHSVDAPGRTPSGHAGGPAANGQRGDLDAQGDHTGQRAGHLRPVVLGTDHLLAQLPDDPAADRRKLLVPVDDVDPQLLPEQSSRTTTAAGSLSRRPPNGVGSHWGGRNECTHGRSTRSSQALRFGDDSQGSRSAGRVRLRHLP